MILTLSILVIALGVMALAQGVRAEFYKKLWEDEIEISKIKDKFIDDVVTRSLKQHLDDKNQGGTNG